MDVVFEGALSRSWSMADVLRGVMGVENQSYGILRISSPGSNVSGRLAVADSAFVVGAVLSDGDTGYSAVRRLLLASDGNFAYLDTAGKRPQDLEQALFISMDKLAEIWPELPVEAADLFDEKALLDKVFGGDGQMPPDPASGQVPIYVPREEDSGKRSSLVKSMQDAASASGKAAHKQAWKTIVQPLLANSRTTAADDAKVPYYELDDTASHERQSLTRLRAQAQSPSDGKWYTQLFKESVFSKPAIWVGVIFVVSIVTLVVTSAVIK